MKVSQSLLQNLKKKHIDINLDKFMSYLRSSSCSSGSESIEQFSQQSSCQTTSTNFRVRAVKKEDSTINGDGFVKRQISKGHNENTEQFQVKKQLKESQDFRMTQTMSFSNQQSPRKISTAGRSGQETSNNNQLELSRSSQSFYSGERGNDSPRGMTVSIYKDHKQNKLREDLLNFNDEEAQVEGYTDGLSNFRKSETHDIQGIESEDDYDENNQICGLEENEERSVSSQRNEISFDEDQDIGEDANDEEDDDGDDEFSMLLSKYGNSQKIFSDQQQQLSDQIQSEFMATSLSPKEIAIIADCDIEQLPNLRIFQLRHDCSQDSLDLLGDILPNLSCLRLNDSIISSLRDIGTSMRQLKVLSISRVSLTDLSGLNAFPQLTELYASFNQITDCNALYFNDCLEIVDLEANQIADIDALDVFQSMSSLQQLTLTSNAITDNPSYSEKFVVDKIPQLKYLDDLPVGQGQSSIPISTSNQNNNDSTVTTPTSKILPSRSNIKGRRFIQLLNKGNNAASDQQQQNELEDKEDLYQSLKQLNWNGEKFLSDDYVKRFDEEFKTELSEKDLLIYAVKKTSKDTIKASFIKKDSNLMIPSQSQIFFGTTLQGFGTEFSRTLSRPQTAGVKRSNSAQSSPTNSTGISKISLQSVHSMVSSGFPMQNFSNKISEQEVISSLVDGTEEAFCGNPLKALKHKRKGDLIAVNKNNPTDGSDSNSEVAVPKSIVHLLEQFKHETSIAEENKLKEDLKAYDCLLESQQQRHRMLIKRRVEIKKTTSTQETDNPLQKSNGIQEIKEVDEKAESKKEEIKENNSMGNTIKRPIIKMRVMSSQNQFGLTAAAGRQSTFKFPQEYRRAMNSKMMEFKDIKQLQSNGTDQPEIRNLKTPLILRSSEPQSILQFKTTKQSLSNPMKL